MYSTLEYSAVDFVSVREEKELSVPVDTRSDGENKNL